MYFKKVMIFSVLAIIWIAMIKIVFAQEGTVALKDSGTAVSSPQDVLGKEGDLQWVWGEIVNLDSQAKTVTLKYLDYETDQEEELVLIVDEKTIFENIKDFNELKLSDTLSVDYIIGADSRNVVKNISLEKPENPSVPAFPETIVSDLVRPIEQQKVAAESSVLTENVVSPSVESVLVPVESDSVAAVQGQIQ